MGEQSRASALHVSKELIIYQQQPNRGCSVGQESLEITQKPCQFYRRLVELGWWRSIAVCFQSVLLNSAFENVPTSIWDLFNALNGSNDDYHDKIKDKEKANTKVVAMNVGNIKLET
ncbi:hypothetical protein chiPu_0006713 [Chiloscyllium punctatum]|uniref:Uncharacterized protein n=1 Tax=Chiloscyllium punctatum TaxID=137246 RepID=A0A401SD59_CHIPU|nr:hypothetical protein [Chiloscyllium punctatum]